MNGNTASGHSPSVAQEILRDASTVVLAVHGVGDHSPVDLLRAAESCVASLWGNETKATQVDLKDIPMPRDVNMLALRFKQGMGRHGDFAKIR